MRILPGADVVLKKRKHDPSDPEEEGSTESEAKRRAGQGIFRWARKLLACLPVYFSEAPRPDQPCSAPFCLLLRGALNGVCLLVSSILKGFIPCLHTAPLLFTLQGRSLTDSSCVEQRWDTLLFQWQCVGPGRF